MKRLTTLLLMTALFVEISVAGVKNVAVVETELDAQSGASAILNPAEVRLMTAELRRTAVENLPRGKYNIMTSETVYSQGGAVLEACADENCVITLGSKIGADYIVRGTISKIQTLFTMSVEMYETEDGNLVASSAAVRSENFVELIEKASTACADMYIAFVAAQNAAAAPAPAPEPPPAPAPAPEPPPLAAAPADAAPVRVEVVSTPPEKTSKLRMSAGAGVSAAGGFGGGITWADKPVEQLTMPYYGISGYLFFDAIYAEAFVGYFSGSGKWASPNASKSGDLPELRRSAVNLGLFAKYPFEAGDFTAFPIIGIDYDLPLSADLDFADDKIDDPKVNADDLAALWVRFGAGFDFGFGGDVYLRLSALYGLRTANTLENNYVDQIKTTLKRSDAETNPGHGFVLRLGVGYRF